MVPRSVKSRMSYSNSTSFPRFDRLVLALFFLSSSLLYLGHTGYNSIRPAYPPGSLPTDARGGGAGSCRMTFMSPSYFHLAGFNKTETRLGNGPWGLYLFREAGWDDDPIQVDAEGREKIVLGGTPALFVPGNAGSFKQVRSLASTATRTYWELPGSKRKGSWDREEGRGSTSSMDFFTLDFNDDFSAFHGQTLFDQAEYTADAIRYILSLYNHGNENDNPNPTSLIVVAHSMGGIVARATFLDPHYTPHSISTLITFATPLLVPPVTIDSKVDDFYSLVNSYWREAYSLSPSSLSNSSAADELRDVVTISIGGGISDEMIASETTSLDSLVPSNESNGFSVSTTSIPGVETPIDHLAILWCNQLMQVVGESLLSIADTRRKEKVVSREARVEEFRTRLLGGLERGDTGLEGGQKVSLGDIEQGEPLQRLEPNERLVVRQGSGGGRTTRIMPIRTNERFSLLTSAVIGETESVQIHVCSDSTAPESPSCMPLSPRSVTLLPLSTHSDVPPILPAAGGDGHMSVVILEADELVQFNFLAISVKQSLETWLLAEFTKVEEHVEIVDRGIFHLLLIGYKGSVPRTGDIPNTRTISEVWLPALDTSLLTLSLRVERSACQAQDSLFAPLLRQYAPGFHESKYYPNVRTASLYTHSSGPYLPPSSSPGSRLQFFIDPTCANETTVALTYEINIDVLKTVGNLFVRYRMALVTIPFALIVLVLALQVSECNAGHPFPSFDVAFALFARRYLPFLLALLLLLAYLQSFLVGNHPTGAMSSPWIRDALLGNSGPFWAPVLPFLVFASLAVLLVEYLTLLSLVAVFARLAKMVTPQEAGPVKQSMHLSPSQRAVAIAFLLLFTIFFAPHQFAYLVLFLIHLLTTVRLLTSTSSTPYVSVEQQESEGSPAPTVPAPTNDLNWDRYHFAFSALLLLLSLLPINALTLIVWVRNLAVGWFVPFSSDHHVLSILGFLGLVESLHSGKMLPRMGANEMVSSVTLFLAIVAGSYSLLYGVHSAYRVYTLANVLSGWLAILMSWDSDLSGVFGGNEAKTEQDTKEELTRKIATMRRNEE